MKIKRIAPPMTKVLGNKYIELWCKFRNEGLKEEICFYKTKYKMQEFVIDLMIEKPNDIGIIGHAYENIKTDKTLQEKAAIRFDLSKCNEKVKAKYMPLTMV